ncbi:MAG: hypothetical protein AWU55_3040 [Halomonadaceae bacterium T82-2]|nr:MAG: hypothetical protein AWU55_3040 [Halomonadaceae bacterium T82-2]
MPDTSATLPASTLVHDILPRLEATESLIHTALQEQIEAATSTAERQRHTLLKQEFELEITMIRLNLDSLMKRHAVAIRRAMNAPQGRNDVQLSLDANERVALQSARTLYERVRAFQTA